ncbi:DUF397 domain-containing protein [Streptomyces vinaceus]|uniref:DUF397 domain-containing protein n=1 Tax=Streptomyces vinaceus TaxID=1960 RepID=UPI0035DD5505
MRVARHGELAPHHLAGQARPDPHRSASEATSSSDQGGQCLEVAFAWRKSSYSAGEGRACVEVATCGCGDTVHVRDSKVADGPTLALAPAARARLTRRVRT